jgi:hypothetical protein
MEKQNDHMGRLEQIRDLARVQERNNEFKET